MKRQNIFFLFLFACNDLQNAVSFMQWYMAGVYEKHHVIS